MFRLVMSILLRDDVTNTFVGAD